MRKAIVGSGAAAPLLLFGVLSWKLPGALGVTGGWKITVVIALLLIGAAASLALLLILRAKLKREPQVEGGAEVDEAMHTAAARLAASKLAKDVRIARLPLALVLGPTGSTKTSIITHSGLDPELLAGEVTRGDAVVATEPLNVWYAHGMLLVEAGGRMLDDAARWRRLIGHLAPRRLAAALGKGRQAPRIAILCFACDDFVKPGAAQNLHLLAKQLRARLGEASRQLGIRLPVYVLFTRADRLPYFADYVRNLTNDEAAQVLGATLPMVHDAGASWAEHEARRLNDAFGRMVNTLSRHRLEILPRETQESVRANAYEFPRELRKVVEPAVQLLVDVFRPSQLGVNPFLRGFYFTGVRPIILRDVASDAGFTPGPVTPAAGAAATSVFSAASVQRAVQQAAASGSGRKVPQWVFLPRVFRDVILKDELAPRVTGGGSRVDLLRRALIGAAAAVFLVMSVGFTVSYGRNSSLIGDARTAAGQALDARTDAPDHLVMLDSLRAVAAGIAGIERSFSPSFHWGLYRGDDALAHLRDFYFARFRTALWQDTQQRLIAYLSALPPRPSGSDFGRAQRALLAYRLTTDRNTRSTGEDLRLPLLEMWQPGAASDSATTALVGRQFAFFGDELPHGNPYQDPVNPDLVAQAQTFLLNFSSNLYYDALFASLNVAPAARFEGSPHVRNGKVVDGAYTIDALRRFDTALDSVEALLERYSWLYDGRTPKDRPDKAQLAKTYFDTYVREWQQYLGRGEVMAISDWNTAAQRLQVLGSPQSPLFEMLRLAAYHTNQSAEEPIGAAFQPLHAVVAPNAQRGATTVNAATYTDVLQRLSAQAGLAAGAPQPPMVSGEELRATVNTLVPTNQAMPQASTTATLLRSLLSQPAVALDGLTRAAPKDALNRAGQDFCRSYSGVENRLPFSSGSTQSASAAAVSGIFAPGGQLSALYDGFLREYVTERGDPIPGKEPLAGGFLNFYRTAVRFREALYGRGANTPTELHFSFEPPSGTSVRLEIDSNRMTWSAVNRRDEPVLWQVERAQTARLVLIANGQETTVAQANGAFALFGLFYAASNWSGAGPYEVEWNVQGREIVGRISMAPELRQVLQRGRLDALRSCTSTIIH